MISKRKLITRALILVFFFFFFFCDGSASVHAASIAEGDPIMQKIIYTSAVECYKGNEMKDSVSLGVFDGTIASLDSTGFNDLNKGVPFYGSETRRCDELLTYDTTNHFNSNTNPVDNYPERREILEKMAYSEVPGSGGSAVAQCVSYPYQIEFQGGSGSFSTTTPKVCASKTDDGWVFSVDDNVGWQNTGSGDHGVPIYFKPVKTNSIKIFYRGGKGIFSNDKWETFTVDGSTDSVAQVLADLGTKIASLVGSTSGTSTVASNLNNPNGVVEEAYFYALCGRYSVPTWSTGIKCDGKSEYDQIFPTVVESDILFDKIKNYNKLVNILSSGKWAYSPTGLFVNKDSLIFSNMQKYRLYQSYLVDVYGATIQCLDTDWAGAGEGPIKLWDTARNKYNNNCFAAIDDSRKGITVYGIYATGYFGKGEMKYTDVITQLNALDLGNVAPESTIDTGDGSATYDEEASCYSSAVKSLGWVLCPVLEFLTEASGDLYDKYVEPALTLNSTLFDSNQQGGKATYDAWSGFRDIANVIFAVLFLVVIFSQLTGVGIDNYGIKKILPKMIIAAILINISYLVCTLLIDLSNIVGSGVQGIFSNMKVDGASSLSVGGTTQAIAATAISSVAVLTTLVTSVAAVWSNPSIILTLLVSALGTIIAIFFLFVILAAREAAVLVLTVISPIAVVLYMLPNTKKVFDKWMKAFQTLLLLFPICGLLVGGGNFVSKLLLASSASGGFFSALMAMIVGIAPIFFIPSLLSNSLKALGNIGAKISSVGGKLGKSVTGGIRGLEGFKNAQQFGAERRTRIKAGFDAQGNQKNLNAFQRAIRGGSRNVERYRGKYQRLVAERGSLEATEGQDFMLETDINNELKRINSSGEINSNAALQAGLANALANGDRAKIGAYTDALSNKGEDGRQAVKDAYESMVGKMSDLSARTFANNIMKKHGANYKNNNRSMFEVVKAISTSDPNASGSARSAAVSVNDFAKKNRAFLAGKSTSVTLGNMDDDAFAEIFGGYDSGNPVSIPDGADAAAIGAAAYDALHDQNANIKVERRKYLEELAKYAPAREQNVNIVGGSVDANVTNPVLNVRNVDGNANANGAVDVNIKQNNDQNGPVDDAGQII